jgi:hypothetical protein
MGQRRRLAAQFHRQVELPEAVTGISRQLVRQVPDGLPRREIADPQRLSLPPGRFRVVGRDDQPA